MDQLSKQSASAADGNVDHSPFRISVEDIQENLVGLAGQLAWLAAVCRVSEFIEASYSQISFKCSNKESNSFEIIPLPLQRVEESNDIDSATCWLPIFKRGIIAHGFPIPDRQAGKSIELPFSLMTDQAGILYPIKYKGKGSINRIQVSGARTEKHRPGLLWKSVTAGFPGKGINFLLAGEITRPQGLAEEARERRLQPMLNEAMDTPVILYDLASDRAWLIPTMSVILLMIRICAREDPSLLAKLPPATPS
ncbi:MAG: hypothetical protein Q9175_007142 [Cornicularia normoerica]